MNRLVYVDNLRGFCMLLGILVHAATLGDFGALEVFPLVSDYFRMATFFLLSGYFGALLLDRRSVHVFLQQRLMNLLVPLVTGVLLLNPVTLWLIYRYRTGATDFTWADVGTATFGGGGNGVEMPWHLHLWFLISLSAYVVAAVVLRHGMARLGRSGPAVRLGAFAGGQAVPLVLAVLTLGAVLAMAVLGKLAGAVLQDSWLLTTTLRYFPYYALGMLLFHAPVLWEACHRADPALIAVATAAVLASAFSGLGGEAAGALNLVARTLARLAITFALLAAFRAVFSRATRASDLLSRSIYSVYLLHYLAIYALANFYAAWSPVAEPMGGAGFLAISAACLALTLAFHVFVIEKLPLLRFLLNGKPLLTRKETPIMKDPA